MNAAVWGMALIVAAGMVVLIAVIAEVRVILHHEKQRRMREEQRVIDGTAEIRRIQPAADLAHPPAPEPVAGGLGSDTITLPAVEFKETAASLESGPGNAGKPEPTRRPPARPLRLIRPPLPRTTWNGATQTIAALRTGVDRLAYAAIVAAETGAVPDLPVVEPVRTEAEPDTPPLWEQLTLEVVP